MTTSPASSAREEVLERVSANWARVQERIRSSGRELQSVRVVGVTKTFGVDEVNVARTLGLLHFGENYVDELCAKRHAAATQDVTWHYLGALQTNKIARVISCAEIVSGVARIKEIEKLAEMSPGKIIDVQINFTGEQRRNGARSRDVSALAARARALGLHVRGLMVVAPPGVVTTRQAFRATVDLADDLGVVERSMGMSDDLEVACELGSTEVRLGRALFGPRSPTPPRLT